MSINAPSKSPVYAYRLGEALYLNLTSACTLACSFCPKIRDRDLTLSGFDLELKRPPNVEEVWAAALAEGLSGPEVVFTGFGEPTLRLGVLLEVTRRLKGMGGVNRVRLDTDGLANLREGRDVTPELAAAGLDAISVSLNAPDAESYARICPSRYGPEAWHAARRFIASAARVLPEVAVSCVGLPELSEEACRRTVEELGVTFRWRPYDRLGRLRENGGSA